MDTIKDSKVEWNNKLTEYLKNHNRERALVKQSRRGGKNLSPYLTRDLHTDIKRREEIKKAEVDLRKAQGRERHRIMQQESRARKDLQYSKYMAYLDLNDPLTVFADTGWFTVNAEEAAIIEKYREPRGICKSAIRIEEPCPTQAS